MNAFAQHFTPTASPTDQAHRLIDGALAMSKHPMVTTKFGPQSAVLLHLLVKRNPEIPVLWVDTGFNTPATDDFALELSEQLDLNLHIFRPTQPWNDLPPELDTFDHARFVRQVKLEPFERGLTELKPDLWFSALRRSQTEFRSNLSHFRTDTDKVWKVSPLLDWSDAEMETYIAKHDLPVNPDYLDPTKGDIKRECGLHPHF